jgi:hypothetical protein
VAAASAATLPNSGTAADGAAEAVAIAPTTDAPNAVGAGAAADTQSLFWLATAALLAIPMLLVMTLTATVLIRR